MATTATNKKPAPRRSAPFTSAELRRRSSSIIRVYGRGSGVGSRLSEAGICLRGTKGLEDKPDGRTHVIRNQDDTVGVDPRGFLAVDNLLRSRSDNRIFAVGDVASLDPGVPKAGVYAVRQGPVLTHNLLATARGEGLEIYTPQLRFLSLISLGGRRAIASWGSFTAEGAMIWRLKDHIDRKFMRRYVSETTELASDQRADL